MFSARLSDGLELRPLEHRNAEELFAVTDANRQYLREWLTWVDTTLTVEDTRKFIRTALTKLAEEDGFHGVLWFEGRIA